MTYSLLAQSVVGFVANPAAFSEGPVGLSLTAPEEQDFLASLQGGLVGAAIDASPVARLASLVQEKEAGPHTLSPVFRSMEHRRGKDPAKYDTVVRNVGHRVFGAGFLLFHDELLRSNAEATARLEVPDTDRTPVLPSTKPLAQPTRYHQQNAKFLAKVFKRDLECELGKCGILSFNLNSELKKCDLISCSVILGEDGRLGSPSGTLITFYFNRNGVVAEPANVDQIGLKTGAQRKAMEKILNAHKEAREEFLKTDRFQLDLVLRTQEYSYGSLVEEVADLLGKEVPTFQSDKKSRQKINRILYFYEDKARQLKATLEYPASRTVYSLASAAIELTLDYREGMAIAIDLKYELSPVVGLENPIPKELLDYFQRRLERRNVEFARSFKTPVAPVGSVPKKAALPAPVDATFVVSPEEALGLPPRELGLWERMAMRLRPKGEETPQTALWAPASLANFETSQGRYVFYMPQEIGSASFGRGRADERILPKKRKNSKEVVGTVSGVHVRIFRSDDGFKIVNLSATNDVYVDNGDGEIEPLIPEGREEFLLKPGALIWMGKVVFQFGGSR